MVSPMPWNSSYAGNFKKLDAFHVYMNSDLAKAHQTIFQSSLNDTTVIQQHTTNDIAHSKWFQSIDWLALDDWRK